MEPSGSGHTVLEASVLTLALRYRPKALPGQAVCLYESECVCARVSVSARCMDGRSQRSSQSSPIQSNQEICGQTDGAMAVTARSALLHSAVIDGAQSMSERCSFQQVLGGE